MRDRIAQGVLVGGVALLSNARHLYDVSYVWYPEGCSPPKVPWLSGVGSSLEMSVSLLPLLQQVLEFSWLGALAMAVIASLIPFGIPLRRLLAFTVLIGVAAIASQLPHLLMQNWTLTATATPCPRVLDCGGAFRAHPGCGP